MAIVAATEPNTTRTAPNRTDTPAPAVEVSNLTRRFGAVVALDRVSLSVREGEFLALLGPSGCGKTTLLRIIAGLDLPDEGGLRIGGAAALDLPAHKRPVNTVFQSYALFPHLNVRDNVAFGLRMKRVPARELETRVRDALSLVKISELAARRPSELSGGQRQRVALARAVVNEPRVLLLDEPLGALDLKLRKELQIELQALQRRLGTTFIYVTHDQDEALVMSDRIAVMNAGRIEQIGEAMDVYERPRNRFVAQFLGSCNLLEGTRPRKEAGWFWVRTALGDLKVETDAACPTRMADGSCTLAIRPEKVRLAPPPSPPAANRVHATLSEIAYAGSETTYHLDCGGVRIHARALNDRSGPSNFRCGNPVAVEFPPDSLVVLED